MKGNATAPAATPESVMVAVERIVLDEALQVRTAMDGGTVKRYADAMRAGETFPPIHLANINGALVLLDGWHRLHAAKANSTRQIEAVVVTDNLKAARWLAVAPNMRHGLPLKGKEKRGVFRAFVRGGQHRAKRGVKSSRDIAAELGGWVSHTTVVRWMQADFPAVYRLMAGAEEQAGVGGLDEAPDPEAVNAAAITRNVEQVEALFAGVKSGALRGEVIAAVEEAVRRMKAAGEWVPFEPDF